MKRTCSKADVDASYKGWKEDGYRRAKAIDAARADVLDRMIIDAKNVLSNDDLRREYDGTLPPVTSLAQSSAAGDFATTGRQLSYESTSPAASSPAYVAAGGNHSGASTPHHLRLAAAASSSSSATSSVVDQSHWVFA